MMPRCGAGAFARLVLVLSFSLSACRANTCPCQANEIEQLADLLADQSLALLECEAAKTELQAQAQAAPGNGATCLGDESSRVSPVDQTALPALRW